MEYGYKKIIDGELEEAEKTLRERLWKMVLALLRK